MQTEQIEQIEQPDNLYPVVYGPTYGGFHLSNECICKYLELKEIPFIIKQNRIFIENIDILNSKNILNKQGHELLNSRQCNCIQYSCGKCKGNYAFSHRYLRRDDILLKQAITELNENNGCLSFKYLPKGTKYRIMDYDGAEYIETEKDIEWFVV